LVLPNQDQDVELVVDTSDEDLLDIKEYEGTKIILPQEFVRLLAVYVP
jgi:predicted nucleic acid-binding protein